ncbi:peptidase inhibitor family I36 protein, partial [Nonomuraea basaltis]|uniref:peptidase inhibitor family I36 protein n=1 Tax=Nonomuraea basaltis TaxID=2495887 RepID=UPI0014873797
PPPPAKTALEQQIAEQLRRAPGGQIINDRQISYDNGAVIVTVTAAEEISTTALNDCPAGWFCLWAGTSYKGNRYQFRDEGYWQDLDRYGLPWFYSLYNRRNHRVFLKEYVDWWTDERCLSAGTRLSNTTSIRHLRAIYLGKSNNPC